MSILSFLFILKHFVTFLCERCFVQQSIPAQLLTQQLLNKKFSIGGASHTEVLHYLSLLQ